MPKILRVMGANLPAVEQTCELLTDQAAEGPPRPVAIEDGDFELLFLQRPRALPAMFGQGRHGRDLAQAERIFEHRPQPLPQRLGDAVARLFSPLL